MATAFDNDEEILACGICFEFYDKDTHIPKFLLCYHSFCCPCLLGCLINNVIKCPLCRKDTSVREGVGDLVTNFYLLPKIETSNMKKKKQKEELNENTRSNWAKAIGERRDSQALLKMVQDSLNLYSNMVLKQIEDNNEKIAILQSLMEEPLSKQSEKQTLEQVTAIHSKSEEEFKQSEHLKSSFYQIEKHNCQLKLKSEMNDQQPRSYSVKLFNNNPLSFNNSSPQGPYIGATMSIFSYLMYYTKKSHQWSDAFQDVVTQPSQEVVVSIPRVQLLSSSTSDLSTCSSSQKEFCHMEFSVNGVAKPLVIICLEVDEAPDMCAAFNKYCNGAGYLSYQGSRVFMTQANHSITVGKFNGLSRLDTSAEKLEKKERYIADKSTLCEIKGALRMRHRGRCEAGVYASSEFSIMCSDQAENYSGPYSTVFGCVTEGIDVITSLSLLDPVNDVILIKACGSLPS